MNPEAALVIAEFDPFHEGHRRILEEAQKACHGGPVIALMSPDFVQRGGPAVEDKYTRTMAALKAGYSCVLELPLPYASGSAGIFAKAGADIAAALGIVKVLCFGSESGDLDSLQALADILSDEDEAFSSSVRESMKSGASYPAALENALRQTLADQNDSAARLLSCLHSPNDRLSVEYLKALKLHPHIRPHTLRRIPGTSASLIRAERLQAGVPGLYHDDFSAVLMTRILEAGREGLTDYQDVSEDLAARIWSFKDSCPLFSDLAASVKTRAWTRTRTDRALTHIMLGIRSFTYTPPSYVRVLGFKSSFEPFLSEMAGAFPGTLIVRTSRDAGSLSAAESALFEQDIRASELYRGIYMLKYPDTRSVPERSRGVIRL